jgi:hypothetical protein
VISRAHPHHAAPYDNDFGCFRKIHGFSTLSFKSPVPACLVPDMVQGRQGERSLHYT